MFEPVSPPTSLQSYLDLPAGQARVDFIEELERQSLRQLTQAIQELSWYYKEMFENTPIPYGVKETPHYARLTEHLVRRAVDRAGIQPLDDYYEGDFDSRRVRWCPTARGTVAQDLRVDAKAETERSRVRPSASQFSLKADINVTSRGQVRNVVQDRIVDPHTILPSQHVTDEVMPDDYADSVAAITTVIFVALFYKPKLRSIILVASPHAELQARYNPSPTVNHIWGAGPAPDDPRGVRINLNRLRQNPYSPWRVQELVYPDPNKLSFTEPAWVDGQPAKRESFAFVSA